MRAVLRFHRKSIIIGAIIIGANIIGAIIIIGADWRETDSHALASVCPDIWADCRESPCDMNRCLVVLRFHRKSINY